MSWSPRIGCIELAVVHTRLDAIDGRMLGRMDVLQLRMVGLDSRMDRFELRMDSFEQARPAQTWKMIAAMTDSSACCRGSQALTLGPLGNVRRMTDVVLDTEDPEVLITQLLAPPFAHDPYPVASRLRELAPMFRSELGLWYASDYASCQDVFRSPNVGQGFNTSRIEQDPRFEQSDSLKMFGRMIPFMDPPDHTRIRQILAPYFTPRAIEASRPYTQALVDRLLDDND